MATTFKKFSELPEITEATESTKVPVLDGGTMKLLNGAKLGGDAGVKTVIIKEVSYDTAINNIMNGGSGSAAPKVMSSAPTPEFVFTTSMTFEEACEILNAGEPLQGIMQFDPNNMGSGDTGGAVSTFDSSATSYSAFNVPLIVFYCYEEFPYIGLAPTHSMFGDLPLYWTADGISTELSSGGGAE